MTTALQGNDAAQHISEAVPQSILSVEENLIFVSADAIVSICEFLKSDSRYAFDFLEAISAVDMIDHNFDQIDWSSTETVPELSAMQMDQLFDEVRKVFKDPENAKPKRSR